MLELVDVCVAFDGRQILDHASMRVESEEIVALLGLSGSGKSTLLRGVAGLRVPDSGSVCWEGADITTRSE